MNQVNLDEESAEKLEALYQARDVMRRRGLVRKALGPLPEERIIDIGCGPGFYVAELLDDVGPDGAVMGVDAADAMLALAMRRCQGRENASFEQADATALPVADRSFDAALSVQVMEHVPDVDAALAEIHRVLRPGGRVVIWDVDWATLSWYAEDRERIEPVKQVLGKHAAHPALPQRLTALLSAADSKCWRWKVTCSPRTQSTRSRTSVRWCRRSSRPSPRRTGSDPTRPKLGSESSASLIGAARSTRQ